MSHRNLGDDKVSEEEVHALKNKLTIQDAQIAAQQTQLMKQAEELKNFQTSLNDALHKLNREAQHSLELEKELSQRSDDYQSGRIALQNIEMSLAGARSATKEKENEIKELQSTMETISRDSEKHMLHSLKLERERSTLEARVRELEAESRKKPPLNLVHHRTSSQPRISSSEDKLNTLQRELDGTRSTLSQTEENFRLVSQKLSQMQSDLVRLENEKASITKRMELRITELTSLVEEKEADLRMVKQEVGDMCREDELMKRIEEDEVKIVALEGMLRHTEDAHRLKAQMKNIEARLAEESEKLTKQEEERANLVREKEEALDDLSSAKTEVQRLMQIINDNDHLKRSEQTMEKECLGNQNLNSGRMTPLFQAQPDETTISYIERLLEAIHRLRLERDSLRRDVHFLESESKFAIESLEAKLSPTIPATENIHQNSGAIANRTKRIVERSVLVATANAIVVGHLDFCNTRLQDQLQDKIRIIVQQADKICELGTQLDGNTTNLRAVCRQKDDVQSQLALREIEWEDERQRLNKQNHSTRSSFEELEREFAKLSRTLENVESERDSLFLQVTNITSELQSVQQELKASESRYSSLQFQQLSTMSATEANRVLRDQLKEMEMRVARRTEQIGIHQHDIRRLETNLRLQEERLGEMTAELETLAAQKDAMVEDCADAREARNTALLRVEALEMHLEASEAKLEQSDKTIVSMVAAYVQTINTVKGTMKKAQTKDSRLILQLNEAQALRLSLTKTVEEEKRTVSILHQCLEASECGARQLTIALAISRAEATNATHALAKLRQEKGCLDSQVTELLSCTEQIEGHSISTDLKLKTPSYEAARIASRITVLETQIRELQIHKENKENEHRILMGELAACKAQLQTCLSDMEAQIAGKNVVEVALEEAKSHHKQELSSLQLQLEILSHTINELQTKLLATEADKERLSADFATTQRDLETRMRSMSADVFQDSKVKDKLLSLKQEHEKELSQLRDEVETANLDCAMAHERVKDIESSRQQLEYELAGAHVSYKEELRHVTEETRMIKEKLENDLTLLHRELIKNSQDLEKSSQESIRLNQELQRLTESHVQERTEYDQRIQSIEKQRQSAEIALGDLHARVDTVTTELDSSKAELEAVQKEKLCLQENMTNLEAELQRSASLIRHQESQLKECEQSIETLTLDRDAMRAEFLQSEKSCKAAEMNRSLQSAQHKREMAELQKELDAIRSKPDLATAMAELEEKTNEMEQLLRKKCAEIEENDDKVLEILKENKKLTAKVESLNRKVQNLQAKLSAAKASIPKAATNSSVLFPSAAPYAETSSAIQLQPSIISESTVAPLKTASVSDRKSTSRVASEVASAVKLKTPERRLAHPTVFKAKSPDKRSSATFSEPENTNQVIGKKRRAPDDFDIGDGLPPQGFTVDSKPDDHSENRTPRVRRILSGGLTGFTPVRRSQTVQPSPKRTSIASSVKSSSLIADVTNSPKMSQGMGKNVKKGWLGKIRHTSSTPRIVSSMTGSEGPGD